LTRRLTRAVRRLACGDFGERLELADALDVEAEHVGVERLRHLGAGLADAGEDDPAGSPPAARHPLELAARDDVEAAAASGEPLQHRQVRVRLDRIADQWSRPARARW
jgi:hypothetical protein